MKIYIDIDVPDDWKDRLDMQWIVEGEVKADRWSWHRAIPNPVDEQLRLDAELWRYAVKKGIVSIHSERIVDYDPETRCSWIQGHEKACDISNDAIRTRLEKP